MENKSIDYDSHQLLLVYNREQKSYMWVWEKTIQSLTENKPLMHDSEINLVFDKEYIHLNPIMCECDKEQTPRL